jgi:hypothetical protein
VAGTSDSFLEVKAAVEQLSARKLSALPASKISMLHEYANHKQGYAPQSATIQGILGEMYETFASDLESATSDEGTKNRDFEDFIATKQEEELEMEETKAKKEKEKAEAEVMLSEATQTYDDTEAQMKADEEFFDDSKDTCEKNSEAWQARKESRQLEIEGIEKALEILTSDEAREKFGKSFGSAAAFVQLSEEQQSVPLQHAYQALRTQAAKTHSLRLAKLASQVQQTKSGHFDKVLDAIDDVIQTLKDEEADDIKKRDECKDKYQEIESTSKDLEWKIEKNEAKISKLERLIADKTEEREATIAKIEQTLEEIKDMEDTRKEENDDFKEAKKDDEDAIELITDAKDALQKFYKENALLQEPEFSASADHMPEFKLSDKGKRKNEAKGIVGLMEILIEDLETEIKNGKKAEEEAQLEFEKNVRLPRSL